MPVDSNQTNVLTQAQEPSGNALQEADTADYTVWSGTRIRKYMEVNPGWPLTFEKHRIRAEIPADSGMFNQLPDEAMLKVTLMAPDKASVTLAVTLDGAPLADLPVLTITMPWKADSHRPPLQVTDQAGRKLGNAAYVSDSAITFTVNETGTFTISEDFSLTAAASAPEGRHSFPAACAALVAAATILAGILAAVLTGRRTLCRRHKKGGAHHHDMD